MSAIAAVPAPAAPTAPPTHQSFIKKLGHLGITVVTKVLPFLEKEAVSAGPLVSLLFPPVGPLYNSVVAAVLMAQLAGQQAADGAPGATGEDKFKLVFNAVAPGLLGEAEKDGLIGDPAVAAVNRYIQAIFDLHDGPAKNTAVAAVAAAGAATSAGKPGGATTSAAGAAPAGPVSAG